MSEISKYRPGRVTSTRPDRAARSAERELAAIEAQTSISAAHIDAVAEIQAQKVSAVAHVGRRAMQDAALLSQVEVQLATAVPHASGRLAAIADLTAIAMTEVVVSAAQRIGRCG